MKMKNRKIRHFTVLEMLISMGLLSVIVFTLLSMLDQSQTAMNKGVSQLDVIEEARIVLDQIENDITCIDYENAIAKDSHDVEDPRTDVLKVVNSGNSFTVYTTRAGKLPRFCKVSYKKSGYKLLMDIETYDESDGSFRQEPTRTLLTNVLGFKVSVVNYESLGAGNEYPQKVMIELQLLDSETRRIGYTKVDDEAERVINESLIKERLGKKDKAAGEAAFKARAARFTRVVSLQPPASL